MWKTLESKCKTAASIIGLLALCSGIVAAVVTRSNDLDNLGIENDNQDAEIEALKNFVEREHGISQDIRNNVTKIETDVSWIRKAMENLHTK